MLETRIISSMEKCFWDQKLSDFEALTALVIFRNECASVQFAAYQPDEADQICYGLNLNVAEIRIAGELAPFAKIQLVENIPNIFPCPATPPQLEKVDTTFLRTAPGLYPDVLTPTLYGSCMPVINQQLHAAYIDFEGDLPIGTHATKIALFDKDGNELSAQNIDITVLPLDLPAQTTRVTNWFYADCIADYYHVAPFSEEHFRICENFIQTAVKNGINMLLTPLFTIVMDSSYPYGERTTAQLLRVRCDGGKYTFDFSLLDRWIEMCERLGVRYYEMPHLFSAGEAAYAPKIMGTVDGVEKKLFDQNTGANSEEYKSFVCALLAALTQYLENKGLKDRCYFHIADEPSRETLDQYKRNRELVDPYLKGWKILDALSHVEYYQQGLCEIPVPMSSSIEDFMQEEIPERWVYYCSYPWVQYSNRLIAMSLPRTRSIGMQMYKYGIDGFLHWGYNFYNSCESYNHVNPFLMPHAGYWFASGDAHVVYPGQDGQPLESLRLRAQMQALDDIRAMQLAEAHVGREMVIAEAEKIVGKIEFSHCVNDTATLQNLRNRMIELILEA